jgi:hypothetical protein
MSVSSDGQLPFKVRFTKPGIELRVWRLFSSPKKTAFSYCKRSLHGDWSRPKTKLSNNKGPSGDKSEHPRDIVEKAREIRVLLCSITKADVGRTISQKRESDSLANRQWLERRGLFGSSSS